MRHWLCLISRSRIREHRVVRALRSPDVVERLAEIGQTAAPSTPDEFSAQIRREFERWGKVVKEAGVKVE